MPDLDIITIFVCESNEHWYRSVPRNNKNGNYAVRYGFRPDSKDGDVYGFSCTCDGYKFRKKCKHIEQVKDQHCGWHQQVDAGEVVKHNGEYFCPKCGGPARAVRVGV